MDFLVLFALYRESMSLNHPFLDDLSHPFLRLIHFLDDFSHPFFGWILRLKLNIHFWMISGIHFWMNFAPQIKQTFLLCFHGHDVDTYVQGESEDPRQRTILPAELQDAATPPTARASQLLPIPPSAQRRSPPSPEVSAQPRSKRPRGHDPLSGEPTPLALRIPRRHKWPYMYFTTSNSVILVLAIQCRIYTWSNKLMSRVN